MFKPKIAVAGASTGFILSLFAGLISGNPFFTVLLRAVLMAILSGVLATALALIVAKFLPELGENMPADADSGDSAGMVDITVGDSSGDINPFAHEEADDQSTEDQIPDFLMSGRFDQASGSAVSQTGEFHQDDPHSGSEERASRDAGFSGPIRHSSGRTSGGLDILPDLDDFVPARKESEGNEVESSSSTSFLDDSSHGQSLTGGNESETMVKAIRTILARDA